MGYFTWYYADEPQKKMPYGKTGAYLLVPESFGHNIPMGYYDGYGLCSDGSDIYELVVDWNREDLAKIAEKQIKAGSLREDSLFANLMRLATESDEKAFEYLEQHIAAGMEWLLTDWKRNIGITIACEDADNKKLRFPIKIAQQDVPYETVAGYSKSTQ